MDDLSNPETAGTSSDWMCRRCCGAPDHSQDFACATCGWLWSVCQDCGNLVPLYRDKPGQEDRCDACGPSEAASTPKADDEFGQRLLAVLTGLGDGTRAMKTKSGVPWERFSIIRAAWRAAGSPKRTDSGWQAWVLERDRLRRQLGSKRAFGPPTSPTSPTSQVRE
jgi:hypothetical protein